jgi:hypothetical protein
MGRLVVEIGRHNVAVIDRVIHDTYPPLRRAVVFGYWRFAGVVPEKPTGAAAPAIKKRAKWRVPLWAWALLLLCLIAQFVLTAAGH